MNDAIYVRAIHGLLGLVGLDIAAVSASEDVGVCGGVCFGAVLVNLAVYAPCAEIMNWFLP